MTHPITMAAVGGSFGRDVEDNLARIGSLIQDARARGVSLLALPEACLGGYLSVLGSGRDGTHDERPDDLPPVMDLGGPELAGIAAMAREMTVVVGFCEGGGSDGERFNSAAAVTGDGVLGVYRKVHQPLGESLYYSAGQEFRAFDSPVGRMGLLICYDKAFPEAARALALDDAEVVACISAWPASRTAGAASLAEDRWTHRFNIFDQARALENQIVWLPTRPAASGRCASSATRRSSGPAATSWPPPGCRRGWRSPPSTSARPSTPRGARCSTCATGGRSCTTSRAGASMPEMTFSVRWPDGRVEHCYSPSLVMHDHLSAETTYTVEDFLRRSTTALEVASARVKEKFGFACTSAVATTDTLTRSAAHYRADDLVEVVRMWPPLPGTEVR